MKISAFMHEALFNKDSGYYNKKNPIGKNADFITAPEISQIFGELVAAYLMQLASIKTSPISLVEMGAGTGTLFFDILTSVKKLAAKNIPQALDFQARATFHIIETSEVLKKIQQEKLSQFHVQYHKNLSEFLEQSSAQAEIFFISNELFDCFPIDQFVKTDIGWCERLIDLASSEPKFILANFDLETHKFVENLIGPKISLQAPFGAIFEHSLAAKTLMSQLCEALQQRGGIAINIDYGYVRNDEEWNCSEEENHTKESDGRKINEFANTLQAIKNHQKTDPLKNIGDCDITALVDFSTLQKIAKNFDLNSSLVTQKEFLTSLEIFKRQEILLQKKSPAEQQKIISSIARLTDSNQMGELFKCLIVWK